MPKQLAQHCGTRLVRLKQSEWVIEEECSDRLGKSAWRDFKNPFGHFRSCEDLPNEPWVIFHLCEMIEKLHRRHAAALRRAKRWQKLATPAAPTEGEL